MNDFLKLFPLDMWWPFVPIFLGWALCVFAPFYMPAYVAIKNRKVMRKRLLFFFLIPIIVYGAIDLFLIFLSPLESYFIYIFPFLSDANFARPIWLARSYNFFLHNGSFLFAAFSGTAGFLLTRYFYRRWEAIVNALA